MKKKAFYIAFTAAFLLIALTVALGTLVFGPSKAGANEQLTKKPVLIRGDGSWNGEFLSDAAAWYSDHFFLRQELISLDNLISAKLFRTSGADSVILGEGGWLYYADTLEDYSYSDPMTEQEIYGAAKNLALMAEYCRENGKEFLFVIAPNKNSLYPEHMPRWIRWSPESNRELLFEALGDLAVPYADLFDAFLGEDEVLYFAHDSHWNSKGAALGADVINGAFGRESSYYRDSFREQNPHAGDLHAMLYPAFRDRETDPVYSGELSFTYTGSGKSPDSITLETAGEGSGRLLAYRDSFGNLLYPYLADSFGEALFSRSTVYDLTGEADFVLIELVERNLEYLLTYVPVMPSPEREVSARERLDGTVELTQTKGKAPEGYTQWKGTLEEVPEGSVYILSGETAYEAFLLKDGSFAVNVPEGTEPEAVLYTAGGEPKLLAKQ